MLMKRLHQIPVYIAIVILFISLETTLCFDNTNTPAGLSFIRKNEPKETAFSILVPKGWQMEGGIYRLDASRAGGPLNAIEAKCDLTLKSNKNGTISFRILPDIVYAHPGIGGGFFPVGGNYQGAEIRQIVDAPTFLKTLFEALHPNAGNIKTLKIKRLPGEKQAIDKGLSYTNQLLAQIGLQSMSFKSDVAAGIFEYVENNIHFREIILSGIIDMPAALTWKNTRTLVFRAPSDQFDQLSPVLDIIRFSVQFNQKWFLKEAQGQQERANFVMKVYDEIHRIDQEILEKTTVNREEIMNDNFLVLTEQEEYVNPHTGKVEVDTEAYKYRWVTSGGDVYYTNHEDENPNLFLQQTDYKLTPLRKRKNE